MKNYYSIKSAEPKFGNVIRLVIGLPFLKINDIPRGIKNINKVIQSLKIGKCRRFAMDLVAYIESFWMKMDDEAWNFFNVRDRTNNKGVHQNIMKKKQNC